MYFQYFVIKEMFLHVLISSDKTFSPEENYTKFIEFGWVVLTIYHRIKITQPNLIILVSFFLKEDALSDEAKTCNTFGL